MRIVWAFSALAMFAASPAAAHTQEQLDCALTKASAELRANWVDAVTNPPSEEVREAIDAEMYKVASECANELGMPVNEQIKYLEYVDARVTQAELARRLAASGVPAPVIDASLDFGPGRSNPLLENLSDEQIDQMIAALAAAGVDVTALSPQDWDNIGGYASATNDTYAFLNNLQ